MDQWALVSFYHFWAGRGGKSALGTRLPCVPLCPLCLLCPLCSLCPLCPLSRVSRVPCIPCVPCVPCVPLCSQCPLSCVSRFPVSLLPFQKNEMFGGVALVSCGEKTSMVFFAFVWQHAGFFFARSGGQRMWFFMKIESKNTKFCLTCLKDNLFNF